MSRHNLDRSFDQERFDELKREAQTTLNALAVFTGKPGQIHTRNGLYCMLRSKVRKLEKHGESYYQFEGGCFDGEKVYYTLNNLKVLIDTANRFLEGGKR